LLSVLDILDKNPVVLLQLWRLLAMAWVLLPEVSCAPDRLFLAHSLHLPSLCLLRTGFGGTMGSMELDVLVARGSSLGLGMRSGG